jgi:predicted transcriptional regulator
MNDIHCNVRDMILRRRAFGYRISAIAREAGCSEEAVKQVIAMSAPNVRRVRRRQRAKGENQTAWLLLREGRPLHAILMTFRVSDAQKSKMVRYLELNSLDCAHVQDERLRQPSGEADATTR